VCPLHYPDALYDFVYFEHLCGKCWTKQISLFPLFIFSRKSTSQAHEVSSDNKGKIKDLEQGRKKCAKELERVVVELKIYLEKEVRQEERQKNKKQLCSKCSPP